MVLENKVYLTKEGLAKLQQEYEKLKEAVKIKTKDEAPVAPPSQDTDSEYSTFQEDLSFLESRAEELESMLKNYVLIVAPPVRDRKIISLGATVTVEVDGQATDFTLVGSLEANPELGRISNESPVGRALLGHRTGDEVRVHSSVVTVYKIKKITYKL